MSLLAPFVVFKNYFNFFRGMYVTVKRIFAEKQIDWKTVDFNKMRVKQLKKVLADWGEDCKGCLEKSEYIKKVKELLPQYVHEEL